MNRASILSVVLLVGGVAHGKGPWKAHADLINSQGAKIGTAMLSPGAKGVKIVITASKLPPGEHGIHIHAAGKCDPPDFKTAEGHLNPEGKKHGFNNPDGPHAGDMQNVTVKPDGTLKATVVDPNVNLPQGDKDSLFPTAGTSIVIHEKADDNVTDPAGNSGARIACGVIKK